jgi:hypothetical protein
MTGAINQQKTARLPIGSGRISAGKFLQVVHASRELKVTDLAMAGNAAGLYDQDGIRSRPCRYLSIV